MATTARTRPSPPPMPPTRTDIPSRPGRSSPLQRQLRLILIAWGFGSYWLWTISGAAMTQFARALHTPDYGFGVLATLPFIGTVLQLPGSVLIERYGGRKALFITFGTIGRLMWTVAALIPWVLPDAQAWWWPSMALTLLISWAAANLATPAWMNWMSDVIPRRIRGRFFGIRNFIGQPIGLLVTLAVGFVLDQAALVESERPELMLRVTSAVLALGGLIGTFDILLFRGVDDPNPHPQPAGTPVLRMLGQPLRDANFRRYLAFNFFFMLALGFIGHYSWLYVFDVVGWSNGKANLLLLGVPLILRMVSFPLWGRLIDRYGKKPILLICGTATIFGSIGFLLISPERFWLGYALIALTSFAWPGVEVSNFNFILDMSGRPRGGAHHAPSSGSAYVAINSLATAAGGILSGLMAAVIATGFADLRMPLPALGIVLTYHGVLFILSSILRALAMTWVLGLEEPRATGTRETIRYMTASLYSNVRQAALMPTRTVGSVARWSYRVGRRPRA